MGQPMYAFDKEQKKEYKIFTPATSVQSELVTGVSSLLCLIRQACYLNDQCKLLKLYRRQ